MAQEILQILLQGVLYVECAVVQTADETRKLRPRSAEDIKVVTTLNVLRYLKFYGWDVLKT